MIVIISKTKSNIKINAYDPINAQTGQLLEKFDKGVQPSKVLSAAVKHAGSMLRVYGVDCLKLKCNN